MSLRSALSKGKKLVCTIAFDSGTYRRVVLPVQLEYVPPAVMADEQDKNRTRVIGQRKYNFLSDAEREAKVIEEAFNQLLANRIVRIGSQEAPVTFRDLSCLIALDEATVASAGGWDKSVDLDSATEAGKTNILDLLETCGRFRDWVAQVIGDVSYFQAPSTEADLKNSVPGADTSSAPA